MREAEFIGDVIAAHGGRSRWDGFAYADVEFSTGGFAFAARQLNQDALRGIVARFDTRRFAASVGDFGPRHLRGEYGADGVRLSTQDGEIVVDRPRPRKRFSGILRQAYWDDADLFYFVSYAMWNYVCFPFLLATKALNRAEVTPWRAGGWRLGVEFAPEFPTHSRHQSFYFNSALQLIRHAYCADVIGPYARAMHHCGDYVCTEGVWLARRRRVVPRSWGALSLPFPTLVWIEITHIKYGAIDKGAPVNLESVR